MSGPLIDWAVATLGLGGAESGDRCVVRPLKNRVLMVAALDGLGHGHEAAEAARVAAVTLESHIEYDSLTGLLNRCHESLRRTRGVVMSLALFNGSDDTLTWLGVGNVEGVLLRANPTAKPQQEFLLLRSGVIGAQMPMISATILYLVPGDTLIFATDGVRSGFEQHVDLKDPPQQIASNILARHVRGDDDALVLVARYLGEGG